jgi:hypothetical protein
MNVGNKNHSTVLLLKKLFLKVEVYMGGSFRIYEGKCVVG